MQILRLFDLSDVPDSLQIAINEIGIFQQDKVIKYVDHDGNVKTLLGDGLHWGENVADDPDWLSFDAAGAVPYAIPDTIISNDAAYLFKTNDNSFAIMGSNDYVNVFAVYSDYVESGRTDDEIFAVETGDSGEVRIGWQRSGGFTTDLNIDTDGGRIYADFDGGNATWTDGGAWLVSFDDIYESSNTRGFFGVTPVTRRPAPTTLGDVIAGVQELGLFHT